jgi:putative ABC transport system permease protein
VALVSEATARQFWPGRDPLGRRFKASSALTGKDDLVTVVGVVSDTLHDGLKGEKATDVYLPYPQIGYQSMELLVRTEGDPLALIEPVRRELRAIDPNIPSDDTSTMHDIVLESLWAEKAARTLLTIFGGLALIMASIGLYGAIAYSVVQRTNEIGVRMALGARPADVLRMIFGEASLLIGSGLVIGFVGALLVGKTLASLLFKVESFDVSTYATVAALTCAMALLASFLPARRATRIEPTTALRSE